MKTTEYMGYTIDITAKQKDGLWAADVCIGPKFGVPGTLHDKGEVEECGSEGEAEEAGQRWGEIRIDTWITSGR
jgi:hypothetical protein